MKACIFDLDGTLTDTLKSIVYSVNKSLEEMNLSAVSDKQCKSFVGNGARYLMEHALDAAGDKGASRIDEAMEGTEVFDQIQGQTDSIPRKPDPAGIYHLLGKMGASKNECLYIGDSEVDIATGIAAGVRIIGVEWGFRSRQALADAGAKEIISAPEQILHFIS